MAWHRLSWLRPLPPHVETAPAPHQCGHSVVGVRGCILTAALCLPQPLSCSCVGCGCTTYTSIPPPIVYLACMTCPTTMCHAPPTCVINGVALDKLALDGWPLMGSQLLWTYILCHGHTQILSCTYLCYTTHTQSYYTHQPFYHAGHRMFLGAVGCC